MPEGPRLEGDTALIVEVPEAEPIVADLREDHDVAGEGVPAHVTVVYPFLRATLMTSSSAGLSFEGWLDDRRTWFSAKRTA